MSLTDIAVILATSQLITISTYFLVYNEGREGRLISLLGFCLTCYILSDLSILADSVWVTYLLYRAATLTPMVLWYLAFCLFTDNEKLNPLFWIPVAYFVLARAIGVPIYSADLSNSTLLFMLIYVIPQLIMLYFSCIAIYLAVRGYKADLVEERRRFRVIFVVSMGILLAIRSVNGFFAFADPFLDSISLFARNPVPPYVFAIYVFCLGLVFNLTVFRVSHPTLKLLSDPRPAVPKRVDGPVSPRIRQHDQHLRRLLDTMENQRLYSQHGLTIADLAKELGIQEYRLRRIINKELEFKNFNQFLNSYRLTEASEKLSTEDSPISSIALDIGFVSLSSFNSAFKARFGMTPSQYRASHS